MKRLGLIVLLTIGLVTIGYSQTRTVKMQQVRNNSAIWQNFGVNNLNEYLALNTADIIRSRDMAIFDIKLDKNGSVLYYSVVVDCIKENWLATNTFIQNEPSGKLYRMPQYDMKRRSQAERGTTISNMLVFACKSGKVVDTE